MNIDDCFLLGHISRKHGFKGDVVAFLDTDRPSSYANIDTVFIEDDGTLLPYFITESAFVKKNHLRITLEGIETEADAEMLIGANLYLPLQMLPQLSGKQFYFHEVEGFSVSDINHGPLGTLQFVIDRTSQPILSILHPSGKEILVPATDDFIDRIDRENTTLHLNAPAGLIELYLEDTED